MVRAFENQQKGFSVSLKWVGKEAFYPFSKECPLLRVKYKSAVKKSTFSACTVATEKMVWRWEATGKIAYSHFQGRDDR